MFIIWGFGHRTVKKYGQAAAAICGRCNNNVNRELVKITNWFTLFFIPIIPYKTRYYLSCPICGEAMELSKEEFFELAGIESKPATDIQTRGKSSVDSYQGKTETQINYLKQMEELRNSKDNS